MRVLNKIKFRLSLFDTLIPGLMRGQRMSDILNDRHYQKTARALMEYTGIRFVKEYQRYGEYCARFHMPVGVVHRVSVPHRVVEQMLYSGFLVEALNPMVIANLIRQQWNYRLFQITVGGNIRLFLAYHECCIIEPDEDGNILHTPHAGIVLLPERFKSYLFNAGTELAFEEVSNKPNYRKWLKISKIN